MSKLDELKKRSELKRQERENVYKQAVGEALHRVLNDNEGLIALNAISQRGASLFKDASVADGFVKTVAEAVTQSITNPIDNFLLICKNRGLTDRHVKVAVSKIYEMYFVEFNTNGTTDLEIVDYNEKLIAVATKLELEQNLWEELPILQSAET